MLQDDFRRGFAELSRRGLTFEAWCYHTQINEVTNLARAFPETKIILDHFGGPLGTGPYNGKQNEIFQTLNKKVKSKKFSVNLIHGVTGSGKTEIYIKLVEDILKNNKSALILVPEIVLTPETAKRFKSYFHNQVGIWNSSMTDSEKQWVWQGLMNKNIKIIIGTRSAAFLPIQNMSAIIIDEEHDASYKQSEGMPTYNARDISIIRAKKTDFL